MYFNHIILTKSLEDDIIVDMYIARANWPSKDGKKVHQSVWLRESYREGGKVKKRNIANLKHCSPEEITAIELALKHKNNLKQLEKVLNGRISQKQGSSVGAVWVLWRLAQDSGLAKVLGKSQNGLFCLWMILARLIDQGSRLSAVRLAKDHAAGELLGLDGFNENDLYKALDWVADQQDKIEKKLFRHTYGDSKPTLFLYDVTSSYLEGDQNELADWGYNRDKKRGKKQLVIGLLCDDNGSPISIKVFKGNTNDIKTFKSQIDTVKDNFGCERVTMVGDRGMIKSGQIEDLSKAGFNYITAITKPQIRSMIKKDVFQLGLFDEIICEIEHDDLRYILRRNPLRAAEMAKSRADRIAVVKDVAEEQNQYLAEHPKADPHKALQKVWNKDSRLKTGQFLTITCPERRIEIEVDEENLAEVAELDGCYVIKTDLPVDATSSQVVHDRYKDLADVETAFRTMKTSHLELRPINVRLESRTRGHAIIVMLAYLMRRRLAAAWRDFDITVAEGLKQLSTLCAMENEVNGQSTAFLTIPAPRDQLARLFKALNIDPPETLPRRIVNVDTTVKLHKRRK
jgi:transposase